MVGRPNQGLALEAPRDRTTAWVVGLALLANLILAAAVVSGRTGDIVLLIVIVTIIALAVRHARGVLYALVFLNAISTVIFAFAPTPTLGAGGLIIFPQDLGVVLLLGAWAVWEAQRPGGGLEAAIRRFAREPVFWTYLTLLVFVFIAIFRADEGGFNSARMFLYAAVAVAVFRLITEERHLRIVTAALVVGASLTSLYGLFLVAQGQSITDADLSTGGTRGVAISASYIVASAFAYVMASRVAGVARFGPFWPLLLLVLAGGLIASGARQTWIGVLAAVVLFAVASPLRGVLRMGVSIGAAVLIALALFTLFPSQQAAETLADVETRAATDPATDNSSEDRRIKWREAWNQVEQQPLLGTGFGATFTYTTNFSRFGNNFVRQVSDDPENTHLWIWARVGTVGFIAWIVLNLLAFGSLLVRFARASTPLLRSVALWGAGSLMIVWAGMAFSPVSSFRSTLFLFWLVFALIPMLAIFEERRPPAGRRAPAPPAR